MVSVEGDAPDHVGRRDGEVLDPVDLVLDDVQLLHFRHAFYTIEIWII